MGALLEYESGIPDRIEEPHRRVGKGVLTWAARVHMLGAALLLLTPLAGWSSRGWVTVLA
ncbi:hypothetical protein CTZ27_32080 [Streptomyces griseocarneus]|nr:hypothetical protein CTZ27_32080 [Streptomyces griseocarneus]